MLDFIGNVIAEAVTGSLRYVYLRIRYGKNYKAVLAERDRHHHERMYRSPLLQIIIILLLLVALFGIVAFIYAGVKRLF